MEKKNYFKPEVTKTVIDYSITLTQSSQTPMDPNTDPNAPPPFPQFLNPMKWFK
jgi:hypothetical protein